MYTCERCGNVSLTKYGSGRFCCRACANARTHTDSTKHKISASLVGRESPLKTPTYKACVICNTPFLLDRPSSKRACCSPVCSRVRKLQLMPVCGRLSAASQQRRSKNEILFAELCAKYFNGVICNVPMFNGWDADIILPEQQIAVMWNGIWHYKQVTKAHSLKQVQNRDRIKLKHIREAGFVSYVIQDMGSHDVDFVQTQFEIFLRWTSELAITHPS